MVEMQTGPQDETAELFFRFYCLLYQLWGGLYPEYVSQFPKLMDRADIPEELEKIVEQLGDACDISQETHIAIVNDYMRVTDLNRTYEEASSFDKGYLLFNNQLERSYLEDRAADSQTVIAPA